MVVMVIGSTEEGMVIMTGQCGFVGLRWCDGGIMGYSSGDVGDRVALDYGGGNGGVYGRWW